MNPPPPDLGVTAADLAPGDGRSAAFDWAGFTPHTPWSVHDPVFRVAYARLWDEFGRQNELESVDVLARRFAWPDVPAAGRWHMRYDFVILCHGGTVAAVADHTAVIDRDGPPDGRVCVHVSHLLVSPPWRRSGLAGWLRALPVATARRLAHTAGTPQRGVVLIGEAEPVAAQRPETLSRLRSFERAGFLKVDPDRFPYVQPDFRPPADIDASGVALPVKMSLVVRQVGREHERTVASIALRSWVESIYAVYADGLRPTEMDAVRRTLTAYPPAGETVRLVPPTA